MKRGIFTEVRYRPAAVQLRTGRREDIIIGPSLRSEEKAILGMWRSGDQRFITSYQEEIDATVSELLKTRHDDVLMEAEDLKVFILHPNDGYIDITNDENVLVPLEPNADNYNYDGTTTLLGDEYVLEMDPKMGLYKLFEQSGEIAVVQPSGTGMNPDDYGTIQSRLDSGAVEAIAHRVQAGHVVVVDGKLGIVVSVSSDTISYVWGDIVADDRLETDATADDIMICEDIGRAVIGSGGVRLYFDIRVRRPSAVGRHHISRMEDLFDLFGFGSFADPKSLLAYDAGVYGGLSQLTFYVYAYDVDESATSPEEYCYDNIQVDTTIGKICGWNFYHAIPVYRIPAGESGDISDIELMLQKYANMIETRSSVKGRKEGRLYAALPFLNEGNGYHSEKWATDYEDTPYSAFADYQAALDRPALFLSNRVTLVDAYAWMGSQFIDGSTVALCFAAKRARLTSRDGVNLGYSTTNDVIEGITSIPWMEYFDDDQCNDLADAGWQLLRRESHTAPPLVFHQVTTDTSIPAKMEEHHTVAIDAMCQTIRRTLQPLLARGYENVISEDPTAEKTVAYLRKLNLSIAGVRSHYVDVLRVFSNIEVITLRQDETNPSRMIAEIDLGLYYPVNAIHFIIWV